METFRSNHNVFISYARENRKTAKQLQRVLEDRGYSIWLDEKIHGGEIFHHKLEEKILQAQFVVLLWSRQCKKKCDNLKRVRKECWVMREYMFADKHNKTIIPVKLHSVDLPWHLEGAQTIELSNQVWFRKNKAFNELVNRLVSSIQHHTVATDEFNALSLNTLSKRKVMFVTLIFLGSFGLVGLSYSILRQDFFTPLLVDWILPKTSQYRSSSKIASEYEILEWNQKVDGDGHMGRHISDDRYQKYLPNTLSIEWEPPKDAVHALAQWSRPLKVIRKVRTGPIDFSLATWTFSKTEALLLQWKMNDENG